MVETMAAGSSKYLAVMRDLKAVFWLQHDRAPNSEELAALTQQALEQSKK